MKAIKLTTAESEAVERAYYEASSFEALMAVLCRQLNADANQAEDGAGNGAFPAS